MKKSSLVVFVVFLGLITASAEMRIWTSKKGDTIEAEYVNIIGSKIVLKTSAGKQLKVPMSGLCQADMDYLASAIPPKMKLTVDVDKDRDTLSSYSSTYGTYNYEEKAETIKCEVEIVKTSREPCNRDLVGHLYVIGKQEGGDLRKLLSIDKQEFSFRKSKEFKFRSQPVTVEYSRGSYTTKRGSRYEGYILVVEDKEGKVLAIESSQGTYEKHLHKIKKAKKGNQLDRDFDVIQTRRF